MPEMPKGNPWPSIKALLESEEKIRSGEDINAQNPNLDDYWSDLIRILQFFRYTKNENEASKIEPILHAMKSNVYTAYLERRRMEKAPITNVAHTQLEILLATKDKK
ncbi:hypothetical protein D9M69_681320 [compost metagenome]